MCFGTASTAIMTVKGQSFIHFSEGDYFKTICPVQPVCQEAVSILPDVIAANFICVRLAGHTVGHNTEWYLDMTAGLYFFSFESV